MAPLQISRSRAGLRNERVKMPGGSASGIPDARGGDGGAQYNTTVSATR